jgi:hypothetical protein
MLLIFMANYPSNRARPQSLIISTRIATIHRFHHTFLSVSITENGYEPGLPARSNGQGCDRSRGINMPSRFQWCLTHQYHRHTPECSTIEDKIKANSMTCSPVSLKRSTGVPGRASCIPQKIQCRIDCRPGWTVPGILSCPAIPVKKTQFPDTQHRQSSDEERHTR